MSKEQRAVFIGVLITLVYPFTIWLEKGVFLYPFPLNEFIFFIVSTQIIYLNFKKHQLVALLSGIAAFFYLLSSPFFWTFVLDQISISDFLEGGFYELIKLLYFLSLLFWMLFTLKDIKGSKRYFFYATLLAVFISSLFFWTEVLGDIGILVVAIISLIFSLKKPFDLLWVLLAYLSIMKFLFFFFN